MIKCQICDINLSMSVEFGNSNMFYETSDDVIVTCSKKCHKKFKKHISKLIKMSDKQFEKYLMS